MPRRSEPLGLARALSVAGALALNLACANADDGGRVLYLANEGVLVQHGDTKVLFDPLFDNAFGQYELVPAETAAALLAGAPPFDGIDAVFVSHAHGDHFAADLMAEYLRAQPEVRLYAPAQALAQLRRRELGDTSDILARSVGIALELGEDGAEFAIDGLDIRAVRVPHSGWPRRMTDIENLVFHVSLDRAVTVMHFGDADPNIDHFRRYRALWREDGTDLALPPYWFFLSDGGRATLDTIVQPGIAIGTHVPTNMPDDPALRPPEFSGHELFTEPGQSRPLP